MKSPAFERAERDLRIVEANVRAVLADDTAADALFERYRAEYPAVRERFEALIDELQRLTTAEGATK